MKIKELGQLLSGGLGGKKWWGREGRLAIAYLNSSVVRNLHASSQLQIESDQRLGGGRSKKEKRGWQEEERTVIWHRNDQLDVARSQFIHSIDRRGAVRPGRKGLGSRERGKKGNWFQLESCSTVVSSAKTGREQDRWRDMREEDALKRMKEVGSWPGK